MGLPELLKKMRNEKNMSLEKLGELLGVSRTFINQIELGNKKLSKMTYNGLIKIFPTYKEEIDKAIKEDEIKKIPKEIMENLLKEVKSIEYKVNIYKFDTAEDGLLNLEEFEIKELVLPAELKKEKRLFGLRVQGSKGNLENNDLLVVKAINQSWDKLNEKIVVVEINKKRYAKLLKYNNYEPYLYNYNDIYSPIQVTQEVKLIGVVCFALREL